MKQPRLSFVSMTIAAVAAIGGCSAGSGGERSIDHTAPIDEQAPGTIDPAPDAAGTGSVAGPRQAAGGAEADGSPSTEAARRLWAVVLAGASTPGDEILLAAVDDAASAGFDAAPTNCDDGAAEALGMAGDGTYTVSLHYATEAEAIAASDMLAAGGVASAVAEVATACPD
jgi:hypothetical protein